MAGGGDRPELGAGDPGRDLAREARRHEDVVFGDADQRRAADSRQTLERVVGGDRFALPKESRPATADRDSPARSAAALDQLRALGVGRRREEPEAQGAQGRLAAEADPHLAPRRVQRQHVRVRARERAGQVQRAHAIRPRERQLLRDHAAHRHAEHVGAVDAERVHEAERVAGHHARRVRVIRSVALAHAAVVERDHPIQRGELGHLKRPRRLIAAEPHDRARAARRSPHILVVHLDVPDPHLRHRETLGTQGRRLEVSGAERGERGGVVSPV